MTYKLVGQEPYQIPSNADLGTLAYQNSDGVSLGQVNIGNTASIAGLIAPLTVGYSQSAAGTLLYLNQVPSNLATGGAISGSNIAANTTVTSFVAGYATYQPTYTATTASTLVALTSTYGLSANFGVGGTGITYGTVISSISNTGVPTTLGATSATTGLNVVYIGTTTNVAVNQMVLGTGVSTGTYVTSISANTYATLNQAATIGLNASVTFVPTVTLSSAITANTVTQNLLFYPTVTLNQNSSAAVGQGTVVNSYIAPTGAGNAALVIQQGGIGVTGNSYFANAVNIAGNLTVANITATTITGNLIGTATTSSNLASGTAGSIPIQVSPGVTGFVPLGTSGYVLTAGTNTATWTAVSGLSAGTATNANNILTVQQQTNATYYPTFVDTNNSVATYKAVYTTSSFSINPSTKAVTFGGSINIANTSYINGSQILVGNDLATVTYTANYITNNPALVAVSGTSTTYGTYNTGTVASILTASDYLSPGGYYSISDAATQPAFIAYVGFTGVADFSRVVFNINYTVSSGHTIDIDLYNYLTSSWDTFAVYSGTTNYYQFILQVDSSVPYISSGTVTARVYHASFGNTAHETRIDYVALEDSIQGGQGPRGATGATGPQGLTTSTTSSFHIYSTASTTSTLTGALIVDGGVGVGGGLFIGGIITSTNITSSISTTTGALQVAGGVGIGGGVYVGGVVTATTFVGALTGIATTSTNIAIGAAGSIPIQVSPGITGFVPLGTSGYVLTAGTNTATWQAVSGLTAGTATNANNVLTTQQVAAGSYYPVFVSANNAAGAFMPEYTTSSFQVNPGSGLVTVGSLSVGTAGATFNGPVTFNGTASYVLSTNTYYTDNILELHIPPGGVNSLWTSDDSKDIGFRFHYYKNSTDTNAALVLANDTKYLEWYSSGAEGTSTFAGSSYGTFKTGNIILSSTASSTSTLTGALVVTGGAGIGGDVYVGGSIYTGGSKILTTSIQEFTATAGQTTFTISGGYVVGQIQVFANGIQLSSADYTASNGTTVVVVDARRASDIIRVVVGQNNSVSLQQAYTFNQYTSNGTTTTFATSYNTATVQVFQNGSLQLPTTYTASNGTSVVFGTIPTTGTSIAVISFNSVSISNAISSSGGTINGTLNVVGTLQVNGNNIQNYATAMSIAMGI